MTEDSFFLPFNYPQDHHLSDIIRQCKDAETCRWFDSIEWLILIPYYI